jgi:hypothetical protein
MKRKILQSCLFVLFQVGAFAQINPVENLTWSHWYEYPRNYFELSWDEPAQPHGELIGYNVYRNNELYRFQTERTIYNFWTQIMGVVTNCDGEMFLGMDNQGNYYAQGIEMHVTAVYQPNQTESGFVQSVFDDGLLLPNKTFASKKAVVYPNPTRQILHIDQDHLEKIMLYDVSGQFIQSFEPSNQINVGHLPTGIYLLKLYSNTDVMVDKLVIQ